MVLGVGNVFHRLKLCETWLVGIAIVEEPQGLVSSKVISKVCRWQQIQTLDGGIGTVSGNRIPFLVDGLGVNPYGIVILLLYCPDVGTNALPQEISFKCVAEGG